MIDLISRGSYYTVSNLSVNVFRSIRYDRNIVFNLDIKRKKVQKVSKSENIRNLFQVACTFDQRYWLFVNTSGKCQLFETQTQKMGDVFDLKKDPHRCDFIGLSKGFLFVNKNQTLTYYSCQTHTKTVFPEFQKVEGIVLHDGLIHIFQLSLDVKHNTRSFIEKTIPCIVHALPKELRFAFLDRSAMDREGNVLLAVSQKRKGKGFSFELNAFSFEKDSWKSVISLDRVCCPEDGYYVNCAIDLEKNRAFLLFSNAVLYVDLYDFSVLKKETIPYGTDICWVDENHLLIASWSGLYLMTLECKV